MYGNFIMLNNNWASYLRVCNAEREREKAHKAIMESAKSGWKVESSAARARFSSPIFPPFLFSLAPYALQHVSRAAKKRIAVYQGSPVHLES